MSRFNWFFTFPAKLEHLLRNTFNGRPAGSFRREARKTANHTAMVELLETRQLLTSIVVTTNSDAATHTGKSLRDAIAQANVDVIGDSITFSNTLAGKKITLSQGELTLTGSMTIAGLGANQLTIEGSNTSRILNINGRKTQSVTITGLTLQHGNSASAFLTGNGGAIFNSTNLSLANDTITGNTAVRGGGIYNLGTLTLSNNNFSVNSAIGGAILNIGTVTSTKDTFSGNSGTFGGGIYNYGTLNATGDSITGNSASIGGGISNNGTLSSANTTISGNTAAVGGGGIYNCLTLNVSYSTISGNTSGMGAGLYNMGTLTSTNNTLSGNIATYGGGGIFNSQTLNAANTTIAGNTASTGGGISNSGTLTLTNSTIAGNMASSAGGGSFNTRTLNAINTIVIGNIGGDVSGAFSAKSSNNLTAIPSGMTLSSILQTDVAGKPLLANNGGPTQTIALSVNPTNPAVGLGIALAHVTATGDGNTALTVDSTTFLAVGDMLRIGTEFVTVTAVTSASTVTVLRGQAGTTQINLNGRSIALAYDQRGHVRKLNTDLGAFGT